MLSLQDVLAMPNDPDPEHLRRLGLLPPAPLTSTPPIIPQVAGSSGVQVPQMSPVVPKPEPETAHVTADAPNEAVKPMTAPMELGELQPPNADLSKSPKSSLMSFPSREEARHHGEDLSAPAGGPAVIPEIGSKDAYEVKLQQQRDEQLHPWGSPENHPGLLGRIGHVAAKIGNIAGDVVAPAVMANIPGTDLHRQVEEGNAERGRAAAETRESETELRGAQERNLASETQKRDEGNAQDLIKDEQGNITGYKDKTGAVHSLDEPNTPQSIKDVAGATKNKEAGPKFEQDQNGNIVALTVDKDGKTKSEVVYKGDPKLESDLVHNHIGADGKPHAILVNKKTGEMIKDLGPEVVPNQAAAAEHGIEVVRATDKDGKVHLMSQDDAKKAGFTHITKASDADVDKAKTHTVTLNDMQAKLNDVVTSRKALDQDKTQRVIIARLLSSIDKYKTIQDLTNAAVTSGATPLTQDYVIAVKSLRESGLGLPKEITGGSRTTEIQSSALWQTLPDAASLNGDYALKQSKKFQANIDRLRERPEIVEGMSVTSPHADLAENKPGEPPKPPVGKSVVYDPQGVAHFALSSKIGEMLKDPKYKGWSQSAPSSSH